MTEQKAIRKDQEQFNTGEKVFIKSLKKTGIINRFENKDAIIDYYDGEEVKQGKFQLDNIKKLIKQDELLFAKTKENAKIPSKRKEDGCYDVYLCMEDESVTIEPGETKLLPTGIASALKPKHRISLRERGSTGKIGLAVGAGQIDSGYRDEWFVALRNLNRVPIEISKKVKEVQENKNKIKYPYDKAVCQAALEIVPRVYVKEISFENLKNITSERGEGKLGSTNNNEEERE